MTQTIEQLTARVRELEEEVQAQKTLHEESQDHHRACIIDAYKQLGIYKGEDDEFRFKWVSLEISKLNKQLAASQLHAEQLREALEKLATIANQYAGHYPYQVATIVDAALSLPADTSAIDSYVREKGVDHGWIHHNDWYDLCNKYSDAADKAAELCMKNTELTRQRDLAVDAITRAIDMVGHPDNITYLQQTLSAIKESEK